MSKIEISRLIFHNNLVCLKTIAKGDTIIFILSVLKCYYGGGFISAIISDVMCQIYFLASLSVTEISTEREVDTLHTC